LTLSTSSAWRSMERFLWITPSPPSWARAMAISLSVTVSIGELTMGMLRVMLRVSRVETSVSAGTTLECRGTSSTSSNVIPVATIFPSMRA